MTTVTIMPDNPGSPTTRFRAVAGQVHSEGPTAGAALDALIPQLDESETGTLVVVQNLKPDALFNAAQRDRLAALMAAWREARDAGRSLPSTDQAELDELIAVELRAAGQRAANVSQGLNP